MKGYPGDRRKSDTLNTPKTETLKVKVVSTSRLTENGSEV